MFDFFRKNKKIDTQVEIEAKKLINSLGVLFGSRVWGGNTKKSDWDYMVTSKNHEKIIKLFKINNIKYKTKHDDSYTKMDMGLDIVTDVILAGVEYQLCVPKYNEVEKFKKVIDIMTGFSKISKQSKKEVRYKSFDNIRYLVNNKTFTLDIKLNEYIKQYHPEELI